MTLGQSARALTPFAHATSILALATCAACGSPQPRALPTATAAGSTAMATARVEIHGHRGARGLFPENTIEGHLAALPMVDVLETDLLVTKDGAVVLHHDTGLNADTTRDASGQWLAQPGPPVVTLTLADLATYDVGRIRAGSDYAKRFPTQQGRDGVRIPTLADALTAIDTATNKRARWNVEIKVDGGKTAPINVAVDLVIGILRERGVLGRVMIQSFDWNVVRRIREVDPSIPTACLSEPETITGEVAKLAAASGCAVWEPSFETLTAAEVTDAHARNVRVIPWTVNEPADIERVIGLGVDGVISDYPDRVSQK
jgi:glycerophosphoryl diester phosphodiesterase